MSIFSEKLTELMTKNNITDAQLAQDLNVSRTTILRWRSGERNPKLPKVKEIAEYFNVNPKVFVDTELISNVKMVSERKAVPKYGHVTAGPNGLAYQELQGFEYFEDVCNPNDYIVLEVKGDSMTGDGIYHGDDVLIRLTPEIERNGQIAVVVINGDEGALKRVYKSEGSITLQSSNPIYPPRTFIGEGCRDIRIVGVLKELKRKF